MKLSGRLLVVAVISVLLTGQLLSTTVTSASADSVCWDYRRAERNFAKAINFERDNLGRVKLSLDPEASKVARKHAKEMANDNELYHTPSSVLSRRVTNWTILGENVGVGGGVESLHDAFMASPSHKENILYSSFRHVGVGVVKRNGRMWVTVIFEARSDPGTRLKMPSC